MPRCVFCEIIAGERESSCVLEDDATVGLLDHRPLFPGHVLLMPRDHYQSLAELPPAQIGGFFQNVQRLCRAVEAALAAEGTFVAINNRVSQSVPHLHAHIVPRRRGDGLRGFFWPRHSYRDANHRLEVQQAIVQQLARPSPT